MAKKFGILMGSLTLLCAVFLAGVAVAFPRPNPVFLELDEEASTDPADYLLGLPFAVKRAEVDVSGVNPDRVGTYSATVRIFLFEYTVQVEVRDTTGPVIQPLGLYPYIAVGRDYVPEDFVESITDCSDVVQHVIFYNGGDHDTIRFDTPGEHQAVIRAVDEWGNESRRDVTFTVDEAPVIIGAFDRHIAVGSDFDVEAVAAADSVDGVLSDRVEVDVGAFDPKMAGDYPITYLVRDNYGLETVKTVTVSVVPRSELRRYEDDLSLTREEMTLLCDVDYFGYEPLAEPDCEAAAALIEPTLINLKRSFGNGGWVSGSGAVYRVTPDFVIFLSVTHVVEDIHSDCHVLFFDGNGITEDFAYVTSDQPNELALFVIPTGDIPTDTLLALKELYVDPDIYSELQEGDEVLSFAKHWDGTSRDLVKTMKVRSLTTSIREFDLINSLVETTWNLHSGMSGTPTVDGRGRLVGAASATGPSTTGYSDNSAFHSKIDVLPELEEKLELSVKS